MGVRPKKRTATGPLKPRAMENGACCMTCAFFDQEAGGQRMRRGLCRRRPSGGPMGAFAVVNSVDWCGDHEAR